MGILNRLDEIREEALTWRANDGGLTWAASDILSQVARAKEYIISNNPQGLLEWVGDPFDTDTGIESELVSACIQWADKRISIRQ